MDYEGEGVKPRGSQKKIWTEVVKKDCQTRHLNKEDAMDCSLKGRKWIKVLNNRKWVSEWIVSLYKSGRVWDLSVWGMHEFEHVLCRLYFIFWYILKGILQLSQSTRDWDQSVWWLRKTWMVWTCWMQRWYRLDQNVELWRHEWETGRLRKTWWHDVKEDVDSF